VVLLGFPAIQFTSGAVANALGGEFVPLFAIEPWYAVFPLFLLSLVDDPGPMEELGWRALALPLLQRRLSALNASLVLGIIWGVWHLPAFYISATPQSGFQFPVFLLGTVASALLMTVIYNSTRRNVLLMFLIHAIGNFSYGAEVGWTATGSLVQSLIMLAIVATVIVRLGAERMGSAKATDFLEAEDDRGAQE
jgi:membrane protease YdiL (CAAX protease family)